MKLFATFLVLLCVGCIPVKEPNPNYPRPDGGAELCPAACANMRILSCSLAEPSPKGLSCEQKCQKLVPPATIGLRPGCIRDAATCDIAQKCTY